LIVFGGGDSVGTSLLFALEINLKLSGPGDPEVGKRRTPADRGEFVAF
jgi:hypothetical protein